MDPKSAKEHGTAQPDPTGGMVPPGTEHLNEKMTGQRTMEMPPPGRLDAMSSKF
ncbi:hypothetical protein AVEN_261397-1, partial [Araneus ventricosus]